MLNETVLKAKEMDEFNQNLQAVEVGDEVELKEVWDGEGNTPEDSYSYLIERTEGGIETIINYEFDIVEENENPLHTIVKIISIDII